MSISSNIKNTVMSAYNLIVGDDDKEKNAVTSRLTPVQKTAEKPPKATEVKSTITVPMVNPTAKNQETKKKIKGIGDIIEVETTSNPINNNFKQSKKSIKEMKANLPVILSKAGISNERLFKEELKLKLSGISKNAKEDFKELNPEMQNMMIGYVLESIERCANANRKGVSLTDAITTDVAMMYYFITHSKNGEVVKLKELTPEQIKERRIAVDKKIKNWKEERMAAIQKLPTEEAKKAALKELDLEIAGYRKHLFQGLYKNLTFQSALELLLIVSVKDIGNSAEQLMKNANELLESYPPEIQVKIKSTMQTFDNFKAYIETVKGRGEDLGDKEAKAAFIKYHMVMGSYKTKEDFDKYMADAKLFVDSRESGEYPDAVYRATAMGVGEGAYANHVMTAQEKNETLSTWVMNYDGYLTDTEMAQVEAEAKVYIEKYLEEHPEEKENFSHAKSIKEIVETVLKREFKPETTEAKKESKTKTGNKKDESTTTVRPLTGGSTTPAEYSSRNGSHTTTTQTQSTTPAKLSASRETTPSNTPEPETFEMQKSPKTIALELISGQINEEQAFKSVGSSFHAFVMMCAENPILKVRYKNPIMSYIKTEKDQKKLQELIIKAPDLAECALNNMRCDKESVAQELLKGHKVDSFTSRLIEKDVKKDDKEYIV